MAGLPEARARSRFGHRCSRDFKEVPGSHSNVFSNLSNSAVSAALGYSRRDEPGIQTPAETLAIFLFAFDKPEPPALLIAPAVSAEGGGVAVSGRF